MQEMSIENCLGKKRKQEENMEGIDTNHERKCKLKVC